MRKERDERLATIAAESDAAFQDLRNKVVAHFEERRWQRYAHSTVRHEFLWLMAMDRARSQAKHIAELLEAVERKRDIEAQMVNVVSNLHAAMREVEAIMLAGYEGREKEVNSLMDVGQGEKA